MTSILFPLAILRGEKIRVYHEGKCLRDFTYIDDIVSGIMAALEKSSGYEIFNLGNSKPIELDYFIGLLENELGKKAIKEYAPLPASDMVETFAEISYSQNKLGFEPETPIEEGIKKTMDWFKKYYPKL